MRRSHFELLRPVCPLCRTSGRTDLEPLELTHVSKQSPGVVEEGILTCRHGQCRCEYPIIDGIPVLVPWIRTYVSAHLHALLDRGDRSSEVDSLIGDCCGAGAAFDAQRQIVSSYVWDHYGQYDPVYAARDAEPADQRPGGIARLLHRGLAECGGSPDGLRVDLGCGPGRSTFELAMEASGLVLGIDLNFALLRIAARVLQQGHVRYPRRRCGAVYETREFELQFPERERVDFWACDATALPLHEETAALAVSLNLLDSVSSPIDLLRSARAVLQHQGHMILACPYDWSAAATPMESWIGGHSQRGGSGDSAALLRMLLTPGEHGQSLPDCQIVAEVDGLPWHVRLHDRSRVHYGVHLLVARKQSQ